MTTEKLDIEQIKRRVTGVIESILKMARTEEETSATEIDWETKIMDDLGVDSVEILDVICSLEAEFNIALKPEEAATKKTLRDIVNYIEANL